MPAEAPRLGRNAEALYVVPPPPTPTHFESAVVPILQRRCSPCHFTGGKMHGELPFDDAETVRKIGTHVLERIKVPDERKAIREFLAEAPQRQPS